LSEVEEISLSVVLEYKKTFSSRFKLSEKIQSVCQKAIHAVWEERTQLAEWKVSDRNGNLLSMDMKLRDSTIMSRETLYMYKKLGDIAGERLLVQAEDEIGQKL
jgi:hypothetical protein